jgi:UDP-2-acetamido-3-amino-2,3-dideoxy-glucuronate N-acetyltransferase
MGAGDYYVHPTAEVEAGALVGEGTRIWRQAHVRAGAQIGSSCNIGKGVFIDAHVRIGSNVKIQNHVSVFEGVTVEDGVFIGPHVCFTNDLYPRAINRDGTLKSAADWQVTPTRIAYGASLGAASVIVCGVTVGRFALVGSGAVVTRNVAPHALVLGNPAVAVGYVCYCARRLPELHEEGETLVGVCPACGERVEIARG